MVISSQQHDDVLKLQSIFMPYATKQRADTFERQKASGVDPDNIMFVHYTSADAALKIIKDKKMWMRNALCMSDYSEVKHGHDEIKKALDINNNKQKFIEQLDACKPGMAKIILDYFEQHIDKVFDHTYVASLSEYHIEEDINGRLSMWRGYGGISAQVAMVFKIPKGLPIQGLNVLFSPVAYLKSNEVQSQIEQVIKNIADNIDYIKSRSGEEILVTVFYMFLAGMTCLKHGGFKEEKEWRALHFPEVLGKDASVKAIKPSVEVVKGIPQIVYNLPLQKEGGYDLDLFRLLDRIIIGPTNYERPIIEAFRHVLIEKGMDKDKALKILFNSGIPIRSNS